jgi:hypothetical protein
MTEEEKKLMKQYAITSEEKTVYQYKGFKYDNFNDALVFAKIEMQRGKSTGSAIPPSSSR